MKGKRKTARKRAQPSEARTKARVDELVGIRLDGAEFHDVVQYAEDVDREVFDRLAGEDRPADADHTGPDVSDVENRRALACRDDQRAGREQDDSQASNQKTWHESRTVRSAISLIARRVQAQRA